jgi:purine-cytosine permease-like protein
MYLNYEFNPAWLFIYVFIYCLFLVSIFGAHQIHKAMYVPAPEEEP